MKVILSIKISLLTMLPLRSLTPFEVPLVQKLILLGAENNWEYVLFLESANGPLIGEIQTSMRTDTVELSSDFLGRLPQPPSTIIHHNHLSQESLSDSDWLGLNNYFFETFAYSEDGTTYRGQVIDKIGVAQVLENYGLHEAKASNTFFEIMMDVGIFRDSIASEATFFRKEIINRAMHIAGVVEYGYFWGSKPYFPKTAPQWIKCSVGSLGITMDSYIDLAAAELAKTL